MTHYMSIHYHLDSIITHSGALQEDGNRHKFETVAQTLHSGDAQRHLSPQLEVQNHV